MKINSKKISSIFLIGTLMLFPSAHIDSMQSSNYAIDQDSINFGGTEDSASSNYRLSDTMGEVATGESSARCASMSFGGTTDYALVPHSASMNITGEITIEAWIKTSYTGGTQMIMEKATSGFNSGYNLLLTSQGLEGRLYPSGIASTKNVRDGQWHNVVMTDKSGAGGWNLYVDGVAVATQSGVAVGTNTTNFSIGKRIIDNTLPFHGQIDDVRVYSRALSATEVVDLYQGKQIDDTGLAGHWGFNDALLGADSVTGGDFESGFTGGGGNGWTMSGSGTFTEETTIVRGGSAQRILSTNNGQIYQAIPVVAGKNYRFSAWVYNVTSLSNNPRMYLMTDASTIASVDRTVTGEWQKMEADYTVENTGNLLFYVGMLATGSTGEYIVDDVSVKEIKIEDQSSNTNDATIYGASFSADITSATCKALSAGYRQMTADSYIAITTPADVTLSPSIGGVTGGTGDGSTDWTVTTDAPAGYQVSVRATSSPALTTGGYSFADYTLAGAAPDFTWSVASTDSEFGFTIEGDDTVDKLLDDGNVCNAGTGNTEDKCWLPFTTNDQTVAGSASANHPLGTSTTLVLRAQSGASHLQQDGTYTATIMVTAVAL